MESSTILVISGGNRAASDNTKIARALPTLAPSGMTLSVADISALPIYNQDLEADFPVAAVDLKNKINAADGIIFVTPEHNRSIPTVLKNALDWASRPYGDSAWAGKPILIMGATPGTVGASQAQAHLRQIVAYLDMHLMGQPETYINSVHEKLGPDGSITDEDLKTHLTKTLARFGEFVAQRT